MTRNKAIRLLTLIGSAFIISPLFSQIALAGITANNIGYGLMIVYGCYLAWAGSTIGLGNIFITLWGTQIERKQTP